MDLSSLNIGRVKIDNMNLIQKIKKNGILINIIYLNIIIYVIVSILIKSNSEDVKDLISQVALPSNTDLLIKKPWTLITYMFIHIDIFHLVINLLWLYFSGIIFLKYLSEKKILSIYLMGGIIGAFFYLLALNLIPSFDSIKNHSLAIGASSSVLAVLCVISCHVPNYPINIFINKNFKIKHLALIAIIIDIMSIPKGNAGGHIAHLGGAFYGCLYVILLKKNINVNYLLDKIVSKFSFHMPKHPTNRYYENDYEYNARKNKENAEVDEILDKINKSGYDSLSKKEKEKLFNQKD